MSAIAIFDIRNFSAHVSHLSFDNKGRSKVVADLIENIFNCVDKEVKDCQITLTNKNKIYLNHTGDGFLIVFYGENNKQCLQDLLVMTAIASDVEKLLSKYNKIETNTETAHLPPLDYGIGLHYGLVMEPFQYQPAYNKKSGSVEIDGLLGHGINLTSRVQNATKKLKHKIICTQKFYDEIIKSSKSNETLEKFFTDIGKHKLSGMRSSEKLYGVDKKIRDELSM